MAERGIVAAIDLGATRYRVALVDNGNILQRSSDLTHPEDGARSLVRRLSYSARELISKASVTPVALGVAVPGPVDPVAGVLHDPPNLVGWHEVPIKALLEDELGLDTTVGNDANLAALGEHTFGAGKGVDDMIYLTVSSGIGGGAILGGKLFDGARGLAIEPGHMSIDRTGPRCACGNTGCLEALASGFAIARIATERIKAGQPSVLLPLVREGVEVSAENVFEAAIGGDQLCLDVVKQTTRDLSLGIIGLVHIFNPRLVVVGGGISQRWQFMGGWVESFVTKHVMRPFREDLKVVPAGLGDNSGLLGAAVLAHAQLQR